MHTPEKSAFILCTTRNPPFYGIRCAVLLCVYRFSLTSLSNVDTRLSPVAVMCSLIFCSQSSAQRVEKGTLFTDPFLTPFAMFSRCSMVSLLDALADSRATDLHDDDPHVTLLDDGGASNDAPQILHFFFIGRRWLRVERFSVIYKRQLSQSA